MKIDSVEVKGATKEAIEAARAHDGAYDAFCAICTDSRKLIIENLYLNSVKTEQALAAEFKLDLEQLKRHINALDLDVVRLDRTDKAAARLMEKALERIEDGREAVSADHLIRLLEHKDKKEGRVVQRVQITKPSVLVLNLPSPLAVEPDELAPPIEGKLLPESTDENDS